MNFNSPVNHIVVMWSRLARERDKSGKDKTRENKKKNLNKSLPMLPAHLHTCFVWCQISQMAVTAGPSPTLTQWGAPGSFALIHCPCFRFYPLTCLHLQLLLGSTKNTKKTNSWSVILPVLCLISVFVPNMLFGKLIDAQYSGCCELTL